MRAMIREITSEEINDLVRHDTSGLKAKVSEDVSAYGVTLQKLTITFARPPADFQASQEARKLAVFQLGQQEEEQALAQRRQESRTRSRQQTSTGGAPSRAADRSPAGRHKKVTELEMGPGAAVSWVRELLSTERGQVGGRAPSRGSRAPSPETRGPSSRSAARATSSERSWFAR
jgi:hypothetical protein